MNWFKSIIALIIVAVVGIGFWLMIFGAPIDDSALNRRMETFNEEAFRTAQANNDLILINFHQRWCPDCIQQKRVLARYFIDFPQSPVKVFEVDFDAEPELVERFRAEDATSLILYRGADRIWYGYQQTNTANIYSALQEAEYHSRLFAEDD
ncbi:thioredoxin [Aliidiomarina sedimenti]|uniref:Thioredoxin n=1 Tax=Aliidiomarina sedimenti TaxID=1933879 RepID=A0ABY0C3M7_9GAMM|nr:thioredoxin family protein [Aliidiomarina sedimenti]RUO32088.1 thioredoxin [Aliidiomarina sedimenti]